MELKSCATHIIMHRLEFCSFNFHILPPPDLPSYSINWMLIVLVDPLAFLEVGTNIVGNNMGHKGGVSRLEGLIHRNRVSRQRENLLLTLRENDVCAAT